MYRNNEVSKIDIDNVTQHEEPRPARICLFEASDLESSPKKMETHNARKHLAKDLLAEYIPPDSPGCRLDPEYPNKMHSCKMEDCYWLWLD